MLDLALMLTSSAGPSLRVSLRRRIGEIYQSHLHYRCHLKGVGAANGREGDRPLGEMHYFVVAFPLFRRSNSATAYRGQMALTSLIS